MLIPSQKKWLAQLSDTDSTDIYPYDPKCPEIFEEFMNFFKSKIGGDLKIVHYGASSLGISGQNEIDVYVLVSPEDFNDMVDKVSTMFGMPQSLGENKRARYKVIFKGKKIDLFVSNEEHEEWQNNLKFNSYLRNNPEALAEYKKIKEDLAGKSTREYYRAKVEFINETLSLVNKK